MRHTLAGLVAGVVFLLTSNPAWADPVLYGGNGNGSPINRGGLVTINQTTGAGTLVGIPLAGGGLSGIAFSAAGDLYGSTVGTGGSSLVRINPDTGALIATIGPITFNGARPASAT